MKDLQWIGTVGALLTGAAIGIQATLSSRSGAMIGPIRTGLFTNVLGGLAALVVLGVVVAFGWQERGPVPAQAIKMMVAAGIAGVFIVVGISFSLQYTGITAGLAAVILGQMTISAVVDSLGVGGAEPIPLSGVRIAGLLVMAVSVYLLLPRD